MQRPAPVCMQAHVEALARVRGWQRVNDEDDRAYLSACEDRLRAFLEPWPIEDIELFLVLHGDAHQAQSRASVLEQ